VFGGQTSGNALRTVLWCVGANLLASIPTAYLVGRLTLAPTYASTARATWVATTFGTPEFAGPSFLSASSIAWPLSGRRQ
jgi:hypothetical protein